MIQDRHRPARLDRTNHGYIDCPGGVLEGDQSIRPDGQAGKRLRRRLSHAALCSGAHGSRSSFLMGIGAAWREADRSAHRLDPISCGLPQSKPGTLAARRILLRGARLLDYLQDQRTGETARNFVAGQEAAHASCFHPI